MRDRGHVSKLVWLLLIAAFAAIAGGGCGGSSSHSGGGNIEGNVRPIGEPDHPLYQALKGHYAEMPNGTIFIGNKITQDELAAAMPEIKAAYDEGKIIGMYAPTQARIEELREMLGVDIFKRRGVSGLSAAEAEEEPDPEFYMITQRGFDLFEFDHTYVDADSPGVEILDGGVSGDAALSALEDAESAADEKISDKSESYGEIASHIAAWHSKVEADAMELKAERESVRGEVSASAAGMSDLKKIAFAYNRYRNCTYDPIGPTAVGNHPSVTWKFPTISNTITVYSCYSFDKDENYYLIVANSSMNNEKNYKHEEKGRKVKYNSVTKVNYVKSDYVYNSTHSFSVEANMDGFISNTGDRDKFSLEDHQPVSMNNVTNETHGCSANLSGSVGLRGVDPPIPNASVTSGITMSNSTSYTVNDFTAIDLTNARYGKPAAKYVFRDLDNEGGVFNSDWYKLEDAPKLARGPFDTESSWIWMVSRPEDRYQFQLIVSYEAFFKQGPDSESYYDKNVPSHPGLDEDGNAYKGYKARFYIDLPMPPTLGLNTAQLAVNSNGRAAGGSKPVTFKLLSDGPWRASCDQDWVTLGHTSGGATGGREKEILVQVDPYDGKGYRSAYITVVGSKDPDGFDQISTIEITQTGK